MLALYLILTASPPVRDLTDHGPARRDVTPAMVRSYINNRTAGWSAHAATTPGFARQTGLACSACHTAFPGLTATGRAFKLNGYVYRQADSLQGLNPAGKQDLALNLNMPLAAMFQTSFTSTSKAQPGAQSTTVFFPDQISLFAGGEVTPHLGGFLQLTFDPQSGGFGVDNTDFRYVSHTTMFGQHATYGVSLNNNPTVQDLWNSTPAWGFPYGSSAAAPSPAASTLIDGNLGQQVAGLTGYTMLGDHLYLEFGGYTAAPVGLNRPLDSTAAGVMRGVAPYWRVALPLTFGNQYLSIGTYGMAAQLYPAGVTGPTNRFTDVAADLSYFVPIGTNSFSANATLIHESQRWDAGGSANLQNTLTTFRFDAAYHLGHQYAFTVAPFTTTGTADTLLYAPGTMTGSRTGQPNSSGLIAEVDIMPWQNLRLQFQYTAYGNFNGATTNYDGFGRNASHNNTFYFLTWILF
jgi:hypothetical protein